MSLAGQNFTPQDAIENEQRFVLDTKEGLQTFLEFLVSEEGQIDALDPVLVIEDLALPKNVETSLKQLRHAFHELIRVIEEGLQTATEVSPESVVVKVANQYQVYLSADESFSFVYMTYEAALKNQPLPNSKTKEAEQEIPSPTSKEEKFVLESTPVHVGVAQASESMEQSEDINTESLKVYGLSLPQAGPEGVLLARSLRDRLEIIKNIHPSVKDSPERMVIVEEIIRSLFVVPESGLAQQQVTRVAELVQELHDSEKLVATSLDVMEEIMDSKEMKYDSNEGEIRKVTESVINEVGEDESWTRSENPKKRRAMKIETDTKDDGAVEITFAHEVAQQAEKNKSLADESVVGVIDKLTQSPEGGGTIAQPDSIYNSTPAQVVRDYPKREVVNENSLTGKYLSRNPQYQAFILENKISLAALEKKLQKTIQSVDAKEIDFWESKFDEPYTSAFSYLQEMTLQEVEDLNALSLSKRKNILQAENVKYEAYLAWMDIHELIALTITLQPTIKFAELLARWIVETEIGGYQRSTSAA